MSGECTGVHVPSHLNKYFAQGDEGRAELCQKQAADEEIPLVLSEELWNQTNRVEHTQSEKTNTCMEKINKTQLTFKDNFWDSLSGNKLRLKDMGKYQVFNQCVSEGRFTYNWTEGAVSRCKIYILSLIGATTDIHVTFLYFRV